LAVLWEGTRDNPAQLRAPRAIIDVVQIIQTQVKLWTEAYKLKQEEVRHGAEDAMDED